MYACFCFFPGKKLRKINGSFCFQYTYLNISQIIFLYHRILEEEIFFKKYKIK